MDIQISTQRRVPTRERGMYSATLGLDPLKLMLLCRFLSLGLAEKSKDRPREGA